MHTMSVNLDINVFSGYVDSNPFYGEYERRMEQERLANQKPSAPLSQEEAAKVKEKIGDAVELTAEATAFLGNVAERKAKAQALQQAAQNSAVGGNAFQYTGDLKKQHLVISEAFSKMGVYDAMSNDEVRQFEHLLKDITAGMDSINDGHRDLDNELSRNAAQVSFMSSVAALQELGKKYVGAEHQERFQALMDDYKEHNAANVAKHISIRELAAQNMQQFPMSNASGYRSNTEAAIRTVASVTHSQEQTETYQNELLSLFEQIEKDEKPLRSIFEEIEQKMFAYASGNQVTATIKAYIQNRDGQELSRLQSYWQKI